ncbi:hypothetical protein Tco_0763766 [Tanacetum coccineum]
MRPLLTILNQTYKILDVIASGKSPLPVRPDSFKFLSDSHSSGDKIRKELKICEAKTAKPSIDEPPKVELKDLPPHLEYAFLEDNNKLLVIIAKDLSVDEKTALIKVRILQKYQENDQNQTITNTGTELSVQNPENAIKGGEGGIGAAVSGARLSRSLSVTWQLFVGHYRQFRTSPRTRVRDERFIGRRQWQLLQHQMCSLRVRGVVRDTRRSSPTLWVEMRGKEIVSHTGAMVSLIELVSSYRQGRAKRAWGLVADVAHFSL